MRDVFEMWKNTRMVVLTAISASLYAAILIPFKVLPIIPGVTELRPANAVPVVCSFLFGPAAAWGAGIGNVIGDFFGGIGPGSIVGFFGNFLYGLLPYMAWSALTDRDPLPRTLRSWVAFIGVILLASGSCALVIGWGINSMGFLPFSILGNIILVNNFVVAAVLTPVLLFVLYPRVKRGRLLYKNILPATNVPSLLAQRAGLVMVVAGVASGMIVGNLLSTGALDIEFLTALDAGSASSARKIALGLLPSIALVVAGIWLTPSRTPKVTKGAIRTSPDRFADEDTRSISRPRSGNAIELDRLTFTYADESEPALRDLSLIVREGEMVAVMGATGAGKSTLAKILNRAIPAFESGVLTGGIRILGRQLEKETVGDLAGAVGLVTQDFEAQLFATNVLQEVAFGLEQFGVAPGEIRRRARAALSAVGLADFEGRDPATLSGGEKQRLAIAATLALEPRILVFDEPTTDLDPLGKLEIFDVLANMRGRGYTLVVIEHETAAAEHADRLVIMSGGKIVADDHPHKLFAQPDFLHSHGVRPTDLGLIAQRLQLKPMPVTIDAAVAALCERIAGRDEGEGHFTPFGGAQDRLRRAQGERKNESSDIKLDSVRPEPVEGRASNSPTVTQASSASAPLVRVENVEHRYDNQRQALRGVSLSIENGELIALIGQNGSGKTTLAKHLNGLLRPTNGRVLLHGKDVQTLPLNSVAGNIGYVFQNPDHQIFAATVVEEVGFGPKNFGCAEAVIKERTQYALDAVGLEGLDGEDPFLLSKGHRQRLAVASLLALQPELLILDEPTTGLDYDEQRRMMDLLARLNREGMAIVIITHSPWVVAEYAERGVLMRRGELIFDGPLRRLFENEDLLESARFCAPDVTRLGRRLGFTPLSVDELVAGVA